MRLICKLGRTTGVYDDGGDYWITRLPDGDDKISKERWPEYPLAACIKWDAEPVDIPYLNALSEGGLDGVRRFLSDT
jgi:hypothetical protein